MAILTPNSFTSWELTETEELEGGIYTITQLQVLQNLLAVNAEEKLKIAFDATQPQAFAQQEAYKRGQIELLEYLIATSNDYKQLKIEEETLSVIKNRDFTP